MKKFIGIVVLLIVALAIGYLSGPRKEFEPLISPVVNEMNISLDSLDLYVHTKEAGLDKLKPDNESRIIWADSIRQTRYSLVYLHGFSASPMESNPIHVDFARRYGMNMYLPLLSGHGLDDKDSFLRMTPNQLIKDAKEAIAIGQLIGEDVIVMSCSTGSTLSVYLAGANPEMIDGLIMYSPNIELYDRTAKLITGPWGEDILLTMAGTYRTSEINSQGEAEKYWTSTYRNEGLIALQSLLERTMTDEVFVKLSQPYFVGFYYKNEEEQDKTISVAAIKRFDTKTSTPEQYKMVIAFPGAGEHVITNPLKSSSVEQVRKATFAFAEDVLGLVPQGKPGNVSALAADF